VSFFFFIKGGGATADGVSTEVVRVLLSKILFYILLNKEIEDDVNHQGLSG
jgi:hypothetical protein